MFASVLLIACKQNLEITPQPTIPTPLPKPIVILQENTILDAYQKGTTWIYRNGQEVKDSLGFCIDTVWNETYADTVVCLNDTIMANRRWVLIKQKEYPYLSALSDSAGVLLVFTRAFDVGEDYKNPCTKFKDINRWKTFFQPKYSSKLEPGDTLWTSQNKVFWYGLLHNNEPVHTQAGFFSCKMFGLCMLNMQTMPNLRTMHTSCMEKNYYNCKVGLVLSTNNHWEVNNYKELVKIKQNNTI